MKDRITENVEKYLVELLILDDAKAFEKLYLKYKNRLHNYCCSMLSVSETAEDVVQETFAVIWEKRKSLLPEKSFMSYLYTIAYNKIISHLRKLQVEQCVMVQWQARFSKTEDTILSEIISEEYESFLKRTTENLPPKRKLVFQLSRENGLSHKEIAEQLGISIHTVQEHISESLVHFTSLLQQHPDIVTVIAKKAEIARAS